MECSRKNCVQFERRSLSDPPPPPERPRSPSCRGYSVPSSAPPPPRTAIAADTATASTSAASPSTTEPGYSLPSSAPPRTPTTADKHHHHLSRVSLICFRSSSSPFNRCWVSHSITSCSKPIRESVMYAPIFKLFFFTQSPISAMN